MAFELIDAITLLFPNYAIAGVVASLGIIALQELRRNTAVNKRLSHNVTLIIRVLIKRGIIEDTDLKDIAWGE